MQEHATLTQGKKIKALNGKGLSVRLVFATLLYSLWVAVFVSVIQIFLAYQQSIATAQHTFVDIESSYLPALSASLWQVDNLRSEVLLTGIAQLPHVSYVRLDDERGQTLEKLRAQSKPLASKTFHLSYNEGRDEFNVGTLTVQLSNEQLLDELKDRAIGIAVTASATLLLGALFVLILFQHWVTRHLEKMAAYTAQLDTRQLDKKLLLDRPENKIPDELDMLVDSINNMRRTIKQDLEIRQQIENELLDHKQNLERIVVQRTQALEIKSEQLEQQTQALETQNRELDAYAHSVAHDLKTPLTTLIGVSSLLNSGAIQFTPEQTRNSIATIHRTATKMSSIIDALLLLASVRRADNLKAQPLDVKAVAQEAQARLAELANNHAATINYLGEWENAMGYGPWIEEVWVNYLSNAIKYGGDSPRIELGCTRLNDNLISFWVRDHGTGISLAKRSDLFIQFSRLDAKTSDGHGLGLSIVKRIVERLQGSVGYQDAEGGGSCFWFSLPAVKN